jgi:chaperonin GroES
MLRPLRDLVVCSFDPIAPFGQNSVIQVIDKRPSNRATVLAVGPGVTLPCGVVKPMQVAPGDNIVLSRFAGFSYESEGQTVRILPEDEILVVL